MRFCELSLDVRRDQVLRMNLDQDHAWPRYARSRDKKAKNGQEQLGK